MSIFLVALAAAVALLVCLNAATVGRRLRVMDHPDEVRKKHKAPTPLVGGIAIILAVAVGISGTLAATDVPVRDILWAVLLSGCGTAVVGFTDDQFPSTPLARTLLLIVFFLGSFWVAPSIISDALHWGTFEDTAIAPWAFQLLMVVSCVGVVNAVNMADGQNGIVSGMFAVWSFCLLLIAPNPSIAYVALFCLAASMVVLGFNLAGKLFLGDCGTYGVTFVLGLLTMAAHAAGVLTIETIAVWFFIPVMDCLRLVLTRPLQGRSPFLGDRDHFHHRLQDKLGHEFGRVTYVGTVAVTSLLVSIFPHLALLVLTVLAAFYFSFAWLTDTEAAKAADAAKDEATANVTHRKVVALSGGRAAKPHDRSED